MATLKPVETEPNLISENGLGRLRYLLGIVVVFAASALLKMASNAVFQPDSVRSGLSFGLVAQLLVVVFIWWLVRLRGERLSDLGLKAPESWTRAIMIGAAFAAVVFVAIYLSEKAGIRRNLSAFREVQGNRGFLWFGIGYSFVGAGFYEELFFRGFVFQGLAMLFKGNRASWIGACVVQAAVFGADHNYQGPTGMVITGLIGLTLGFLFLQQNRNLWPLIIGHGLYDAFRFVLFYFQGPPPVG